jgi:hypothetical protein
MASSLQDVRWRVSTHACCDYLEMTAAHRMPPKSVAVLRHRVAIPSLFRNHPGLSSVPLMTRSAMLIRGVRPERCL